MGETKAIFILLCSLSFALSVSAQNTVSGIVRDSKEEPVAGASVIVISKTDTLTYRGGTTDEN